MCECADVYYPTVSLETQALTLIEKEIVPEGYFDLSWLAFELDLIDDDTSDPTKEAYDLIEALEGMGTVKATPVAECACGREVYFTRGERTKPCDDCGYDLTAEKLFYRWLGVLRLEPVRLEPTMRLRPSALAERV